MKTKSVETSFAVPHNETLLQELKDYASKHQFSVSIKGTVANATMPESLFESDDFMKLLLKLETEFENELRRINMKENKENKNTGGWREDADPTCINKKGKPVARRHHNVAAKGELQNTLRTPLFAPVHTKSKEDEGELAEEIVDEVQEVRTESAKAKDESRTAKKVGDKEDAEDLVEWIKEPGESDLEGVDTRKSKKNEDEEE